jgi:Autoinducer binding domain
VHDLLTISRAAFDFVDAIERVTDPGTVIELFDGELKRYGFHAWLITGLPNHGERIDPLMMLNGWPKGWTETYTRLNLVQNDPVVAHCFRGALRMARRALRSADQSQSQGGHGPRH